MSVCRLSRRSEILSSDLFTSTFYRLQPLSSDFFTSTIIILLSIAIDTVNRIRLENNSTAITVATSQISIGSSKNINKLLFARGDAGWIDVSGTYECIRIIIHKLWWLKTLQVLYHRPFWFIRADKTPC